MPRISQVISAGLAADRPAATSSNTGYLYASTDINTLSRSNGSTWNDIATSGGGGSTPFALVPADCAGEPLTLTEGNHLVWDSAESSAETVTFPAAADNAGQIVMFTGTGFSVVVPEGENTDHIGTGQNTIYVSTGTYWASIDA